MPVWKEGPNTAANILVVFYSHGGSVNRLLTPSVKELAREAGGQVRLRRAPNIVSPAMMELCTSESFGVVSPL